MSDPKTSGARKSKVIAKESLSAYQRWELPVMEGADQRPAGMMTAQQLDDIHKQAYEEGLALGRRDAEARSAAQAARIDAVLRALAAPLADFDQQVEREVAQLAMVMARHIVRRELRADAGAVVAVVREALTMLPSGSRQVQVQLHPEDAVLVRELLHMQDGEQPCRIVDDPVLVRGDCRVVSETSRIDASVESRLNALVSAAVGGERKDDGSQS